jgi:uncharacterized protein (DUF697 family)
MISLVPGAKQVIGAPFAGAATYAMGQAAKRYFASNADSTREQVEADFREDLKRRGVDLSASARI